MKNTLLHLFAKIRPVVLATLGFLVISSAAATTNNLAYMAVYPGDEFGTIDLDTGMFTHLGNSGQGLAGLGVVNGTLYGSSFAGGNLYRVNPANGSLTLIGTSGISYDQFGSTTQGLFAIGSDANLYSVNPTTGAATLIGPTGIGFGSWRNISCNAAILYYADGSYLYTINTTTGAASLIGSMGGPLLGAILLENGILYGGQESPGAHVDTLNPNTGLATVGPALTGASAVFGGLAPYPLAAVFEPVCTNMTVTLSAGSNSCVVVTNDVMITNGLVAWYKADGNATDSYGTNNGAAAGGLTYDASQSGQAFKIQPSPASQDVGIGSLGSFDNATGFTVSAYIKYFPTTNGNFFIFSQGTDLQYFPPSNVNPSNCPASPVFATAGSIYFFLTTNQIGFALPLTTVTNVFVACTNNPGIVYGTNVNYGTNGLASNVSMPTNQWIHLAVTWRSLDGLAVLYSNGVAIKSGNFEAGSVIPVYSTAAQPAGSIVRSGPAVIGAGNFGVTGFADPITVYSGIGGEVDNLRLYTRALSAGEIQQTMQADSGATVTNCTTVGATTTNLYLCTTPPGTLQIQNSAPGQVKLSWASQNSAWYLLQSSDVLSPLNWTQLFVQMGNGSNTIVFDPTPPRPKRFYRLLSTQ